MPSPPVILAVIGLIFNAGGFVWLAMNHFRSVNKKLDDLSTRLSEVEQDIAFIKGRIDEMVCMGNPARGAKRQFYTGKSGT